jgi:hypothetical protein
MNALIATDQPAADEQAAGRTRGEADLSGG